MKFSTLTESVMMSLWAMVGSARLYCLNIFTPNKTTQLFKRTGDCVIVTFHCDSYFLVFNDHGQDFVEVNRCLVELHVAGLQLSCLLLCDEADMTT